MPLVVGAEHQERHHQLPLIARTGDAVGGFLGAAQRGHQDRDQDRDDADDDEQFDQRKAATRGVILHLPILRTNALT
jgi:hypothetical protein